MTKDNMRSILSRISRIVLVVVVLLITLSPVYLFWILNEYYQLLSFAFFGIVILAIGQIVIAGISIALINYDKISGAFTILLLGLPAYISALLLYKFEIIWPIYVASFIIVMLLFLFLYKVTIKKAYNLKIPEEWESGRAGKILIPVNKAEYIKGLNEKISKQDHQIESLRRQRDQREEEIELLKQKDEKLIEDFKTVIKDTVSQVDRYTKVEFPTECVINEEIELSIQLTLKRPIESVVRQLLKIPFRDLEKEVILTLEATASGFQLDNHRKTMKVPIDTDSEKVYFKMQPLSLGKQVVEVEIFCNANRIGYFGIETQVSDIKNKLEKPSNITLYENPVAYIANAHIGNFPLFQTQVDRILHVTWDKKSNLTFSVYYPKNIAGDWKKDIGTKDDIIKSLKDIQNLITSIAEIKYHKEEDKKSIIENMHGIGATLYKKLFPYELGASKWKSGTTTCISTNETWIPWEILDDGEGFWGQRFLLFRMPRLEEDASLNTEEREISHDHSQGGTIGKIVNVVGGDIQDSYADRAKRLFKSIEKHASIVLLEKENLSGLMGQISEADLVHFTCHGHEDYLQISKNQDKQINLMISSIENKNFVIRNGSIVFANACSSSLPLMIFGDFSSFGWKFYNKGAAIFIGTIGTVPTESAIVFAENFYSELFKDNGGGDLGMAFLSAKNQPQNKDNNLFYILYCIYGNPIHIPKIYLSQLKDV